MKLSTSKGTRAESPRPKKRKWPWILAIIMLPFAALAILWFSSVRLPTGAWEAPGGLVGGSQSLPDKTATGDSQTTGDNTPNLSGRQKGIYTFLLCGVDEDKTRTDTIMVASLDIEKHTLGLVSIPRDTYVPSASRNVKKINGAYAGKNMDRLMDEVKTVVGFRPDYWLLVDYNGFVALVDAIGGVEFDVPVDLPVNEYQSVTHKISAGVQTLNGIDALGVVRHRKKYATQDLQRASVQRDMLKAIAKKMLSNPASLTLKLPQLKNVVVENLQTELKWGEITALALEVAKIDMEDGLKSGTIPTHTKSGTTYEAVSTKEALELINATVNPFDRPITEADLG